MLLALFAFYRLLLHLVFISCGIDCPLSRSPVQCVPPAMPSQVKLLAFRLAPFSDSRMYVMMSLYPIALATRQHAPYSMEQAFCVPSVHRRLISQVRPSSKWRLTGLPHTAHPTIAPPSKSPIANLHPTVGLWWRWCSAIKSHACLNVIGLISVHTSPFLLSPQRSVTALLGAFFVVYLSPLFCHCSGDAGKSFAPRFASFLFR